MFLSSHDKRHSYRRYHNPSLKAVVLSSIQKCRYLIVKQNVFCYFEILIADLIAPGNNPK